LVELHSHIANRRRLTSQRFASRPIHNKRGTRTKNTILMQLETAGLVRISDDATFPDGLKAGVFPPVLNDGTGCPQLPRPLYSRPGSVFHGQHSYPGGLPIHESNNDIADVHLSSEYLSVYGLLGGRGLLPILSNDPSALLNSGGFFIDLDQIVGAPIWH